jgi:hypothetical protein
MTRYYKIILSGYGGYSNYIRLTKESYDYWYKNQKNNSRTDPLLDYITNSTVFNLPPVVDFLQGDDWQDSRHSLVKQDGIDYRCCNVTIQELPYHNAKDYVTLLDEVSLQDYSQDYDAMITRNYLEETESHYMMQVYNSQKGIFFESTFSSLSKFNPNKLIINLREYFNGDYVVETIHYDNDLLKCENKNLTDRGVLVNLWKSQRL